MGFPNDYACVLCNFEKIAMCIKLITEVGGVTNCPKCDNVIYERPLRCPQKAGSGKDGNSLN